MTSITDGERDLLAEQEADAREIGRNDGPPYPSWREDPEKKRYSATVALVCVIGFAVFLAVAAVCGVINQLSTR